MELDVTHMVEDADDMPMLSGSIMELGNNAGRITWNNSKAYGAKHPLLTTEEMREEAREYFKGFGAWDDVDDWSEEDLQGIMCQDVASAIREMESADDHDDYVAGCESGRFSGRLYKGDDDRWYFYVGD